MCSTRMCVCVCLGVCVCVYVRVRVSVCVCVCAVTCGGYPAWAALAAEMTMEDRIIIKVKSAASTARRDFTLISCSY